VSANIIVLGSGGHAKALIDLLLERGVQILMVTDTDSARWNKTVLGLPVAGADDTVLAHAPSSVMLVNGVGSVNGESLTLRRRLFERFSAAGYRFAEAVHPSAVVSRHAQLGEGVQIMAGAILQTSAVIGRNSLVNTGASVDHDCVIGEHVHIGPGVTLSGAVWVGDQVHVGVGAVVRQGVRIGARAVIGAGAIVMSDIAEAAILHGAPNP
jgi:UDP-perosamine 4-acetyltransferase